MQNSVRITYSLAHTEVPVLHAVKSSSASMVVHPAESQQATRECESKPSNLWRACMQARRSFADACIQHLPRFWSQWPGQRRQTPGEE